MAERAGLFQRAIAAGAAAYAAFLSASPVAADPVADTRSTPPAPGFGYYSQTPRNVRTAEASQLYEALFGRIATRLGPTNPRWNTFNGEMTPENITSAIDQANTGNPWTLCDMYRRAIEQDAHLAGIVAQRFAGIVARPDRIEPPKHLARDPLANSVAGWLRAVREQIEDFDDARFALLWADGQGWAAAEIVWGYRRVIWYDGNGKRISGIYCIPVRLPVIEGRSFRFDMESDEALLWLDNGPIPLPPAKVIFHTSYGYTSVKERRGFMRACIWLHAMKQWCLRDMVEYLNLYGIPQMIAEYDPRIYKPEEAREMTRLLQQYIGQGGIPTAGQGQLNLRTDTPPPQWALVHRDAAEFLNGEMTKVVSLGPLTMESSGGSYGLGDIHAKGAYNGMLLSGQRECRSIRRDLWTPSVQMNKFRLASDLGASPEDICAVISDYSCQIERTADPKKRQKILSQAMRDGCELSKTQYRSDLQLDQPKDEDDALKGEAESVPSGGALVSGVDASKGVEAPKPNESPAAGSPERPEESA